MQLLGVLLMVQLLRLQRLLSLLLVLTRMLLVVNPEWTMALEMGGMKLLDQWVKLRLSEYLPVIFQVLFMYLGRFQAVGLDLTRMLLVLAHVGMHLEL